MAIIGIDASRAVIEQKTGTEGYTLALVEALAQQDAETQYRLYVKHNPGQAFRSLGGNFYVDVLRWPPRYLWSQGRLSLEMLMRRPELLFVPAHTVPVLHPRRTVTTAHDVGFLRFPELYSRRELLYHRWSMRYAVTHAAHVITPSAFTKSEIVELYNIPPERITPIHHGYNTGIFRPLRDDEQFRAVRERYGIHRPFFFYVGRIEEKKNIPRIIEAFALYRQRAPHDDFQLVLAGKPNYHFREIQEQIRRAGLEGHVLLLGYIPDEDVAVLMNAAVSFLFPTLYEGFGFPVLEAQSCGTPVLAGNVTAVPEVGGEGALYVDPRSVEAITEGMTRLANDSALREELRSKGFDNIQRFTWERCAHETLAVLRNVLAL